MKIRLIERAEEKNLKKKKIKHTENWQLKTIRRTCRASNALRENVTAPLRLAIGRTDAHTALGPADRPRSPRRSARKLKHPVPPTVTTDRRLGGGKRNVTSRVVIVYETIRAVPRVTLSRRMRWIRNSVMTIFFSFPAFRVRCVSIATKVRPESIMTFNGQTQFNRFSNSILFNCYFSFLHSETNRPTGIRSQSPGRPSPP